MARPQGVHTPYMIPLGSSLKFSSNTEFNTAVNTFEDVVNVSGPGIMLAHIMNGTDVGPQSVPADGYNVFTSEYTRDGVIYSTLDYSTGNESIPVGFVFNDQKILQTLNSVPFTSGLRVRNKNNLRKVGDDVIVGSPEGSNRATVMYATKTAPWRPGAVTEVIQADFASGGVNVYAPPIVDVTGGGQLINHTIFNSNLAGLNQTWVRYTFDDKVIEVDLSVDMLPFHMVNQEQWAINPFSYRYNKNLKVELKDVSVVTGTHLSECLYTVDF